MQRALQIAALAESSNVKSNPKVGCVVVFENIIIGEGYHQKFGKNHAEVNAINAIDNKLLLKESTIYVTLEPCCHVGKTPPCADLLIKYKPKLVVIATKDPNILVAGKGIEKLQQAGILVLIGVMKEEAEKLNASFFINKLLNRPYVFLKWAKSNDGFIAKYNIENKLEATTISNEFSNQQMHVLRNKVDAILIGKNTLLIDNPNLTIRNINSTKKLTRIVIDNNLETLNKNYNFYKEDASVIVFNKLKNEQKKHMQFITYLNIADLLHKIFNLEINTILIEGGKYTLDQFINQNLWDEALVIIGDININNGLKAPQIKKYTNKREHILGNNKILEYVN